MVVDIRSGIIKMQQDAEKEIEKIEQVYKSKRNLRDFAYELNRNNNSRKTSQVRDLENLIPNGGKYKVQKRMAKHFSKRDVIENYLLTSCIKPTIQHKKFTKKVYLSNKKIFDGKIKNGLKTFNRIIKQLALTVKPLGENRHQLVEIE
ncbi:MAG TPA: hypothetical protein VNW29_05710 [Candidatus Sulfotelmatobacter sp.]|jgi:hypothetical protein|nr:hypothetical protein [Candidatus Sulfotelmatobacter sp.]